MAGLVLRQALVSDLFIKTSDGPINPLHIRGLRLASAFSDLDWLLVVIVIVN